MNVTWILEPDMIASYHKPLVAEIESQGHNVEIIPAFYTNLDWGDTDRFYDDFAPEGSCVICHASFQFTSLVAEDELWSPGTYGITETIDCSSYLPHLSHSLLNKDYELLTQNELISNIERLIDSYVVDDRLFVRPDSGGKPFTGRLFSTAELTSGNLHREGISPQAMLLVSSPKAIIREWRFIIADQNVVAGSMYRESDMLQMSTDIPVDAMEFATTVARGYQPDRVWELDICESPGGELSVVEINSFSSSNWYSCNLADVVSVISRIALEDWKQKS